jgi:hypothetical protein
MGMESAPLPFSSVGQLRLALSEMESLYAQGATTTVGQMLRPFTGSAVPATRSSWPVAADARSAVWI